MSYFGVVGIPLMQIAGHGKPSRAECATRDPKTAFPHGIDLFL